MFGGEGEGVRSRSGRAPLLDTANSVNGHRSVTGAVGTTVKVVPG